MSAQLCRACARFSALSLLQSTRNNLHRLVTIGNRRQLLSAAFASSESWRSDRSKPEFAQLSVTDLGNQLLQTLDRGQPVAPVDFDIFVQKLDEIDSSYIDFFETVLKKFQATQESLQKLESTDHGLVRAMLQLKAEKQLLYWLGDAFQYGVFLDEFSASLLIDKLLNSGDNQSAALASFRFVQQDPAAVNDVCLGLLLLAATRRIVEAADTFTAAGVANELQQQQQQQEEEEEDDDEAEVVYVDWIRQPSYDDNFDIKEEKLQLGKTLWHCARQLAVSDRLSQAAIDAAIIGLAACELPDQLQEFLSNQKLSPSSGAAAFGSELLRAIGQPTGRQQCSNESISCALQLLNSKSIDSTNWSEPVESVANQLVAEAEPAQAQRLAKLYSAFNAQRSDQLRRHHDWLKRRDLFRSVKAELDALVEEQELLTSFANSKELMYSAWLAPRTRVESSISSKELWQQDVDNLQKFLDEYYAARPVSDRPTTKRTRSDRIVVKKDATSERFKPLKE